MASRYVALLLLVAAVSTFVAPPEITVPWQSVPVPIPVETFRALILNAAIAVVATAFTIRASRNMSAVVREDLARKSSAGRPLP